MRRMVLLPFLCLVIPLIASGNDNKDERGPAKAIQGEWTVVSLGSCGYQVSGTAEQPLTILIDKDRFVSRPGVSFNQTSEVSFGGSGIKYEKAISIRISERDVEGYFRLDPSKTPSWIDLKQKGKESSAKGIYKLNGNELEICMGKNGKRPDEFKNGDSTWLFRLTRKEKKD